MIAVQALIDKFRYALIQKFGYIWGAAGILWTTAKQKQKVDYMINKYGTGWKNNSEAKDDKYYGSALYGDKWIGHYVADCSGLFVWAFKQLGGAIAHGSNSIYDRYCSAKGNLNGGRRSDGNGLLPGTAVFTNKNGDKTHIGLYVGGDEVIEASGSKVGVITSKITDVKWKCWGELKNVDYSGEEPGPTPDPGDLRPTLRKGSKGEYVTLLQTMLINKGYSCGTKGADGIFGNDTEKAVRAFQEASGLSADGIAGKLTWSALDSSQPVSGLFTVHVPNMTQFQAEALIDRYPGSWMTKEGR